MDETYPAKTTGMGLPYGANCVILTSIVLTDPFYLCDGQTYRWTDGRWHIAR